MEVIEGIFGTSFGFFFYQLFSNPSHKLTIDKRWPKLAWQFRKIKRSFYQKIPPVSVEKLVIIPSIKIRFRERVIHIHHWMTLTIIFGVLTLQSSGFTQLLILKSFCFGGALQGLLYKDRFKIITPILQ
jgi:hypothetical protein